MCTCTHERESKKESKVDTEWGGRDDYKVGMLGMFERLGGVWGKEK